MEIAVFSTPNIDADYVLWLQNRVDMLRERNFARIDIDKLLADWSFRSSRITP